MESVNLGRVTLHPCGEYNSETEYERLDFVTYKGGSYFCIASRGTKIVGKEPTENETNDNWQLVSKAGTIPTNYDEQVAQIKQNKEDIVILKEEVDKKITKIYVNNQGETYLEDSDNGQIQNMFIYGKSEQKQYSGKNLLNYDAWKGLPITRGTAVFENNGVTLTATENDCYTEPSMVAGFPDNAKIEISEGKTVILSWESPDIDANIFIFPNGETEGMVHVNNRGTKSLTYTATRGITFITFRFGVANAGDTISYKNIQIEKGSEATSYEPYTGGIPSPNPSYPQEIKSVANPTVKVGGGKNLWSGQNLEHYWLGNEMTINNDCMSSDYIPVNGEQTIYMGISYDWNCGFSCYDSNRKLITKDIMVNDSYTNKDIDFKIASGITAKNTAYIKAMFSKNEKKPYVSTIGGAYEPYHEQTVILPYTLNAIPVSSSGNITIDGQQYVSDYFDVERGKLVRIVEQRVLKNAIARELFGDNYLFYWNLQELVDGKYASGNYLYGYCDHYIADGIFEDKHLRFDRGRIYIKDDSITNLSEFNDKYAENGLKVAYVLNTPEEIDLASEEVQALKTLATYYPTTNISITSEQLDGHTTFNYPISFKDEWSDIKHQISSIKEDYQLKGDYPTKEETKEIIKTQTNHITFQINSEDKGLDLIYTE